MIVIKQSLIKKFVDQENVTVKEQVPYSLTLWQLYIDLERHLGTFETVSAAYKKMIEIKIITPHMLVNYA